MSATFHFPWATLSGWTRNFVSNAEAVNSEAQQGASVLLVFVTKKVWVSAGGMSSFSSDMFWEMDQTPPNGLTDSEGLNPLLLNPVDSWLWSVAQFSFFSCEPAILQHQNAHWIMLQKKYSASYDKKSLKKKKNMLFLQLFSKDIFQLFIIFAGSLFYVLAKSISYYTPLSKFDQHSGHNLPVNLWVSLVHFPCFFFLFLVRQNGSFMFLLTPSWF